MVKNSRKRHILKSLSWRIIGSVDTFVISWLITENIEYGVSISLIEVFTKILLYYFHERIWFKTRYFSTSIRHVVKTFTWRFFATADTVLIAYLISGDIKAGISIGLIEVLTKMTLYYLHEKLWYGFKYGLKNEKK